MRDFINWLYKVGYPPFSEADIKDTGGESILIRAKDDKQGKKSLYYSYDGSFGTFYSCRTALGDYWYNKANRDWTPEEKDKYKAECEERRRLAEVARQEQYETVAASCRADYNGYLLAVSHQYAEHKGINIPAKVKIHDGNLIIPAVDINGKMWTMQSISPDGDKQFRFAGRKNKNFFPIGYRKSADNSIIYFCEGFATGCTIHEAISKPTIICFDAGNLMNVIGEFRNLYPNSEFIICADNDQWTLKHPREKSLKDIIASDVSGDDDRWAIWRECGYTYNTGVDKAGQAGVKYSARVVIPDIPSDDKEKRKDYNDMGVDYTRNKLSGVGVVFSTSPESVPLEVERDSPSPFAPSKGDVIISDHYEPINQGVYIVDHNRDLQEKTQISTRSDGNPDWFTDMIWNNEPSKKLPSVYAIKDLHDGKRMNNLIVFIRGYLPKMFVMNEFSDEIIIQRRPPWLGENEDFRVHRVNDSDRINLSAFLEFFGFSVSDKTVEKAIIAVAEKDKIHPVKEYFDKIVWDKIPRLDTWLSKYLGSTQSDVYLSSIGSKWLMAGAARIYEAGCQFSHMLVLEGLQDIGKSAVLRELATFGDDIQESYFTDGISAKGCTDKFAAMMWQGKLIIEFGELGGMDKADIEIVKAWISRRDDEYQKKGSNDIMKRPRQFILSGTTNRRNWINDSTGGKRFWPVSCLFADVDGVKSVRKQLWAEAIYRYKSGERYWLDDDDPAYALAKVEQSVRINTDEWQDILEMAISSKTMVLPREVYEWLHIDIGHLDNFKTARIRNAMNSLGFEYKQSYKQTGTKNRVWIKE